ncbi:unnamed protein product, partial [Prunus brigantina]
SSPSSLSPLFLSVLRCSKICSSFIPSIFVLSHPLFSSLESLSERRKTSSPSSLSLLSSFLSSAAPKFLHLSHRFFLFHSIVLRFCCS